MSQRLPCFPNLEHLKKQAKDVLRVARHRSPEWRLVDAQQALARGYGFATWAKLKAHVASAKSDRASTPSDRGARLTHADGNRVDDESAVVPRLSDHPIVGTWLSRANGPVVHGTIALEVECVDDTLLLTQIAEDAAGRDVATKLAIQVDGRQHPIPFGDRMFMSVSRHDTRGLVTRAIQDDRVLAEGAYEVSEDGGSLRIDTARQSIVFERV